MANDRSSGDQRVSGWAVGGIIVAAVMLMLIGFFQLVAGVSAIIDDEFFVVTRNYTFDLDTSAWGWLHLLLGLLLLFTAWGLFTCAGWAVVGDLPGSDSARWRTSSSSPTTPSGRSS